jgi:hypothetical protein
MRELAVKIVLGTFLIIGGGGWCVAVLWAIWHYLQTVDSWSSLMTVLIFAPILPFWHAFVCWAHEGFFNTYTILVCVSAICSALVQKSKSIPDEFWLGKKQ